MSNAFLSSISQKLFIKAAALVGAMRGGEKRIDVYRNFYATACEVVIPQNLPSIQQKLLKGDVQFSHVFDQSGEPLYLVTAVGLGKDRSSLDERQFFMNAKHIEKIGLPRPENNIGCGDKTSILLKKSFAVETLGQSLGENTPIRPRAQFVETISTCPNYARHVRLLLSQGNVDRRMDLPFLALR